MTTKVCCYTRGRLPLRTILTTGVTALLFATTSAFAQAVKPQPADSNTSTTASSAKKDDVVNLQTFEVTGSRIKRLDTETPSPVVSITAGSIENKGFSNFADAIRSLPFNAGQALTPQNAGSSFSPGVSTFNMRGLGNNNTLILINGRRGVPYATPGFDGFQQVFDLDSIPTAALESVEILKDGASAIYGSDAVAGVMNVRLKEKYQGSAVTLEYGDFFSTGGATMSASFIAGAASGKANMLVAASWSETTSVEASDFSFTNTANHVGDWQRVGTSYLVSGGNKEDVLNFEGLSDPYSDGFVQAFTDKRSSTGYPGSASAAGFSRPATKYNFLEQQNFIPETRNINFYTKAKYDFTDSLYAGAELGYSYKTTLTYAASSPAVLANEQGLTPDSRMYIPASNPYNPSGVDIKNGSRRLLEAGPRYSDVSSESPRVLATLGGTIPGIDFFRDWTWETGALFAKNTITNTNSGTVADYKLQQALLGLSVDPNTGKLTYNQSVPPTVFFNWFGPNDPRMGEFLTSQNPNIDSLQYELIDFHVGGPLTQLPGGPLSLSLGAEHYSQYLEGVRTDLNATGNVIGGSEGTGFSGSRTVNAVYAELSVPVTKALELQIAGRYETYSDKGFQERLRPKFAIKFKPLDWLLLRASYSQSYKAPDLKYLYATKTVTFSTAATPDPVTGGSVQIQTRMTGNPDLRPETTDTYYAGIVLEPQHGILKGFYGSLDFYRLNQTAVLDTQIGNFSTGQILRMAQQGIEPFASMVVRNPAALPADQTLLYIQNKYVNIGDANHTGLDFELGYQFDTAKAGRFLINTQGNYLIGDNYFIGGDKYGNIGPYLRRFRGNAGIGWNLKDWQANFTGYFIQGADFNLDLDTASENAGAPDLPAGDWTLYYHYRIKNQTYFNFTLSYSGFWNTKITIGLNNVFNQMAPRSPYETLGFGEGINYASPRAYYIRLSREF